MLWRSFCFLLVSGLLAGAPAAQSIDEVVLPAKTEIFIRLERSISSKTASAGDRFHARTEVPVTIDDRIVIPKGSYLLGTVDLSNSAGRIKGKARLRLGFDTVILPDGTTRRIEAVLQSAEGQRADPQDETGTLTAEGSQTRETIGAAAGGAAIGGVIGVITGGASGLATGGLVGGASGALAALFKKGNEVVLPRGSSLTVQLETDVRFVKPRAPGAP